MIRHIVTEILWFTFLMGKRIPPRHFLLLPCYLLDYNIALTKGFQLLFYVVDSGELTKSDRS